MSLSKRLERLEAQAASAQEDVRPMTMAELDRELERRAPAEYHKVSQAATEVEFNNALAELFMVATRRQGNEQTRGPGDPTGGQRR